MTVDFHCHTTASDGSLEPSAVMDAMRTRGVQILSITDHDTLRAYEGLSVTGARLIVGIEISTTWRDGDVHILGYGVPLDSSALTAALAQNRAVRTSRVMQIVAALRRAGYHITHDDVRAEVRHDAAVSRRHVARALVHAGFVRDIETAFRHILGPLGVSGVSSKFINSADAVDGIRRSGGVAVLAHPGSLTDIGVIDDLAAIGVAGLEVFYGPHSASQTAYYRAIARRLGLVMTAGSDFHGGHARRRGVGMEVDEDDLKGFLELLA